MSCIATPFAQTKGKSRCAVFKKGYFRSEPQEEGRHWRALARGPRPVLRGGGRFPCSARYRQKKRGGAAARIFGSSLAGKKAASGWAARRARWPAGERRRGRARGGLVNRYRVVKPYRGFESLRLRQIMLISLHN